MALEIERKYLVINENWKSAVAAETVLKQGYLAAQPDLTVRVRIDGAQAQLTIKSATSGISRSEYEYAIPQQDAEEILANLVTGSVIDKTRYKVHCGEHMWDLDLFHGENEGLQSEDEPFEMPDWVGEEVSDDPRYYNANLVRHPYRDW
jgi:adenylate cyclase